MNLALIVKLVAALNEAKDHLDWCGYGDEWERECAYSAKLPEKLRAAIAEGQRAIDEAAT